ncbi:MAG TPA: creatininase family protein [Anaerolineales bacterium]
MTEFFPFADLTWPEVAGLPRDLPLVIPLGSGYPLERLASALGEPIRAGLLPAIPFGWPGSGLAVPAQALAAYLANLLDSLQDDGFSRVYALTPPGLNWATWAGEAGRLARGISLPQRRDPTLAETAGDLPALPPDEEREKVVLIPIGHTEQHGYHLPLSTDTLIVDAIVRGVVDAIPSEATRLPVMPYGVSTHRSSFAGTLNAGGRAYEDFWLAVVDALVQRGFDRLYLISGHGGNCSFLVNVVKYAGERHRRIFCATAWLYLSGPEGAAALQQHRRSPIGGMGHAGELETSLICHLKPDLVHMERVVDETDFIATPSYYMDWAEGGALVANPPWDDDTATGAYGAGSLASRENGERWLAAAISEKIAHVAEIHEQHERRSARRRAGYGLWGDSSR